MNARARLWLDSMISTVSSSQNDSMTVTSRPAPEISSCGKDTTKEALGTWCPDFSGFSVGVGHAVMLTGKFCSAAS